MKIDREERKGTATQACPLYRRECVKGKRKNDYPDRIRKGIEFHRMIDDFTDHHNVTELSKARLRPKYSKCSGIIVDLYYDHFLASDFEKYSSPGPFLSNAERNSINQWVAHLTYQPVWTGTTGISPGSSTTMSTRRWLRRLSGNVPPRAKR